VQEVYGLPTEPAASSGNSITVTGYLGQFPQDADLKVCHVDHSRSRLATNEPFQSFLTQFRTDMNASTHFTLQTTDDGSDPQNATEAGIEANLDVQVCTVRSDAMHLLMPRSQYTVGIATGVPINFLSVGNDVDDGNLGGFLDTVNFISSEPAVSTVVTTSYDFDEKDLPLALANKLCNAYAALGAQGVSILFSSGDGGVAGTRSDNCTTFVPTFPSTCP
jgi:tripeptidyl-peptidase-1